MFSGSAAEVDAYLAAREAGVAALRTGAEKRVHWAGAPGVQTPLSIVYVHGFSATAEEIRPVPDRVAQALGANLHYTRLAGHGRDGPAMGAASLAEWRADTAEALGIGRTIGERVLVMSCSTGGTLVADALGGGADGILGSVFVAPNLGVASLWGRLLLRAPGVRAWGPVLLGKTRSFEPISPEHERWWTTRFPTRAVFTMDDAVARVWAQDRGACQVPALVLKNAGDKVVSSALTDRYFARWGGAVTMEEVTLGPGDDANAHVIAGDIFSPGRTEWAVERITTWVRGL